VGVGVGMGMGVDVGVGMGVGEGCLPVCVRGVYIHIYTYIAYMDFYVYACAYM